MGATVLVRPAHARDDAPAQALLKRAGLPLDGYEQFWRRWVATHRNGELAGVVALERHGSPPVYLLRSLAVARTCEAPAWAPPRSGPPWPSPMRTSRAGPGWRC